MNNRFNLTFKGELLPGKDPQQVRKGFAVLFNLHDVSRVEPFFTGEPVILRRNLERKEAADYYHKLQQLGAVTELVKVAEAELQKLRQEREAAKKQAERERKKAEALAREAQARAERERLALLQEQRERRRALEESQLRQAASHIAGRAQFFESSFRDDGDSDQGPAAGEPNLYNLRPFRNSREVQGRAAEAARSRQRALLIASFCLAGLLIATGLKLQLPSPAAIAGPWGAVASPNGELFIAAGDQLLRHDRSGTANGSYSLEAAGLTNPQGPMLYRGSDIYLIATAESGDQQTLQRCELAEPMRCYDSGLSAAGLSALATTPAGDTLLALDVEQQRLLRLSLNGQILQEQAISVPAGAGLFLEGGLLYITAAEGPALGVHRYDPDAFGQQLDQILLLPPGALEAGRERPGPFLWAAGSWWAILDNLEGSDPALYRFDKQWNPRGEAILEPGTAADQLLSWGSRTLLIDRGSTRIVRINAGGQPEAVLQSTSLQALAERRQVLRHWLDVGWRSLFILLLVGGVCALCLAQLHNLCGQVYHHNRSRGAAPLEALGARRRWLQPRADRQRALRQLGLAYGGVALIGLALATDLPLSPGQLFGLLLLATGPAIALWLLYRSPPGYVAVSEEQLLLVDHNNLYHHGSGGQLQYRGNFLLIDDVVVFLGNRLLPQFEGGAALRTLSRGGVQVDRSTLLVRLWQGGHPLAHGAAAIAIAATLGAICLVL